MGIACGMQCSSPNGNTTELTTSAVRSLRVRREPQHLASSSSGHVNIGRLSTNMFKMMRSCIYHHFKVFDWCWFGDDDVLSDISNGFLTPNRERHCRVLALWDSKSCDFQPLLYSSNYFRWIQFHIRGKTYIKGIASEILRASLYYTSLYRFQVSGKIPPTNILQICLIST